MNYFEGLGDPSENGNPHFSRERGKIPGGKDFYRRNGTFRHFGADFRAYETSFIRSRSTREEAGRTAMAIFQPRLTMIVLAGYFPGMGVRAAISWAV
jgi:hypothetical protein